MIYKIFYQKDFDQVPVRENTDSLYVEAESEADVRKKLSEKNYNLEFITPISGEFLAYEQQKEHFTVEKL
ncbi:DNA-dependent RNA polymerase subunit epsilon [Halalkalibacterium halodurans]|uniref:DNA-directed RNA polymerase subunit epsilon n=1 Tax=Halalkalibacterium halodurans (strain ATCC BAA-125 / DSM 18197 / FERM 7344 / JCM 9153 / C-125) TaxID=272558 RepID=RPOY_HALH5|nr:DNA-dependent RNA polymerase subunit epsilon [Halalkalibacterium halodurans]Q9K9I6.1 RecName: Full=DNA-directed RNA polymerase subunit epsilon; Short=RNAP epsilon subunit; AltName: Full=RNA polymerase epsilon subunit; AltName: Full=Transcriptase subunit epsilon [Halalkalibacterium halodurans C-125]MED4124882.1 DNA-dependent RNA polymerase subunit epsilon [Halalkalibacterium halodurans]MED4173404.1 DNA-dependent RNA polymerase subunit epsilon [Halalkalibacterium halodurans]BAB06380.1 BH2661 [